MPESKLIVTSKNSQSFDYFLSSRAEVSQVKRGLFLKAINLSMFFVASRIILFCCFVLYVLVIQPLTAEAVFVSMALFNTLRLILTFMFPSAISQASELKITCRRIEVFAYY